MIKNFLHKGLMKFYKTGDKSGVHRTHVKRLRMILARLDAIQRPQDMNLPGFYFHSLGGNKKGHYSVRVNKNWRVIFQFDDIDPYDVNYIDYH